MCESLDLVVKLWALAGCLVCTYVHLGENMYVCFLLPTDDQQPLLLDELQKC